MRVNKKGRVDFAEVWDGNTQDSSLKATIIEAIQYNTFTPFVSAKGKRIKESALVLMEIPATEQQLLSNAQDTTIPNKSINAARFLGVKMPSLNTLLISSFIQYDAWMKTSVAMFVCDSWWIETVSLPTAASKRAAKAVQNLESRPSACSRPVPNGSQQHTTARTFLLGSKCQLA